MHRWNTAVLKVTLTLKKDGCGSLSRNIFTRKIFSRAQHKSCGVGRGEKHCVCLSLKMLSLSSTITTKLYTCTHTQGSGEEVTGETRSKSSALWGCGGMRHYPVAATHLRATLKISLWGLQWASASVPVSFTYGLLRNFHKVLRSCKITALNMPSQLDFSTTVGVCVWVCLCVCVSVFACVCL